MRRAFRLAVQTVCAVVVGLSMVSDASAQGRATALAATRADGADLRAWDQEVDQRIRSRDLRVRDVQQDPMVAAREHQRLDQYYRGLRVFGGDVTRQTAVDGTVSIFGVLHSGIDLDVVARLTAEGARQAIPSAVSGEALGGDPELGVLPLSDGYHLAYRGRAKLGLEPVIVFIDANTGQLLRTYSAFIYEVGIGKGTFGDTKKLSTTALSGAFVADDRLRPSDISTYDMRGDIVTTELLLDGVLGFSPSDLASSTNNDNWTDPTVVDAHVYAGWFYDYLFKRFGRRGIDGQDLRMKLFTHPVSLGAIGSASSDVLGTYYLNAFNCPDCGPDGRGMVVLGEGAPTGFVGGNVQVKPFSASFDVVAHELTHGVTAATADLNGFPLSEGGALNESFSDIFGTATAFFFDSLRTGVTPASYLLGRDLTVPPGAFIPRYGQYFARSISNPLQTGNPDHYSRRGTESHFNSTIMSHAFYLAVEGGTNRTSGLAVQGVGAANREQIEKVFFRALTSLLPSSATFALARVTTIQAARDLYGAGGTVERAVTQAWDAVGVQLRTAATASGAAVPTTASQCRSVTQPSWGLYGLVAAGDSTLQISSWQFNYFDAGGSLLRTTSQSAASFASFFSDCGPGSTRVQAQTEACTAVCISLLGGRSSGGVQLSFAGTDTTGRAVNVSTPVIPLVRP
jgi:thermolysin